MVRSFILFMLFSLSACNKSSSQKNEKTITIAASSIPQADLLKHVQEEMQNEGITLIIKVVDDYNIPNRALAEGDVDANFFQHKPFLEEQIKQFHYPLCVLADIHIEPMGIYSNNKPLSELGDKGIIAIPNDPTNEARALLLLEREGLLTLKTKNIYTTTILDIEENPKKLKFKEIDAALLTRALPQVDAAVIPTNYALLAGLTPEKDALCLEDKTSPYVNVIVVRCDELTSPKLLALKKCMQSDAMRAYILSEYQGAILPAF